MLHILKLVLPALIPSWNFFDVIVPSPRIQFVIINRENSEPTEWQEFRPRPAKLSFFQMMKRMIWNPVWNESLFLMSCAERLMDYPTQHSEDEIFKRLKAEIIAKQATYKTAKDSKVQFRLMFIRREGNELKEEVKYQSKPQPLIGKLVR